jgi:hypothetical protein
MVTIKRGVGAMTEEELEEVMLGDEDEMGPCAPQNLRMSIPMPVAPETIGEEEMDEDLEIAVIE